MRLGTDVVKKLAADLTGEAIQKLVTDLGGAAIEKLVADLGADIVKKLAADLSGAAIEKLVADLGAQLTVDLATAMAPRVVQDLSTHVGRAALTRYVASMGTAGIKDIVDAVGARYLGDLTKEIGEASVSALGAKAIKEVGPHLSPAEIGALITAPGVTERFAKELFEQAGAGPMLRGAAGHFGSVANLGKIIGMAEAKALSGAQLKSFVDAAVLQGWKKIDGIEMFFKYGGTSGRTWTELIDWGRKLTQNSAGSATKVPGRSMPSPSAPYSKSMADAAGNVADITFTAGDAAHVASRHTWQGFAVTPGNAKDLNNMWPTSVDPSQLEAIGARLLQDPAVATAVAATNPGKRALVSVSDGAFTYEVQVTLQNGINGLVSFYPTAGNGVELLSKDAMRAIVWLFKSK